MSEQDVAQDVFIVKLFRPLHGVCIGVDRVHMHKRKRERERERVQINSS